MAATCKPPMSPKPLFDPPRMIFPKREVDNMPTIDRPPRPCEDVSNAGMPVLLENFVGLAGSSQGDISFPINFEEQQEAQKQLQREQRQVKKVLKGYGIDLNEWRQFAAPWI